MSRRTLVVSGPAGDPMVAEQLQALRAAFPKLGDMTTGELIAAIAARANVKKQGIGAGEMWSLVDGVDAVEIQGPATILVIQG